MTKQSRSESRRFAETLIGSEPPWKAKINRSLRVHLYIGRRRQLAFQKEDSDLFVRQQTLNVNLSLAKINLASTFWHDARLQSDVRRDLWLQIKTFLFCRVMAAAAAMCWQTSRSRNVTALYCNAPLIVGSCPGDEPRGKQRGSRTIYNPGPAVNASAD